MSEIILDMWLYTHHTSALLAKKSDNINKVSPILLPLQTLHIKSTNSHIRNQNKYLHTSDDRRVLDNCWMHDASRDYSP